MAKLLPEFPTEWHQQTFLEGCEREVEGCKRRIFELQQAGLREDDPVLVAAQEALENATREVARVGGRKAAAKRPAKAADSR